VPVLRDVADAVVVGGLKPDGEPGELFCQPFSLRRCPRVINHAPDDKAAVQGSTMALSEGGLPSAIHNDRDRKSAMSRISGVRLRRRVTTLRMMSAA
jgi:hypothetical protein